MEKVFIRNIFVNISKSKCEIVFLHFKFDYILYLPPSFITIIKVKGIETVVKVVAVVFYSPSGANVSTKNGADTITYFNGRELNKTENYKIYGFLNVENKNLPKEPKEGKWSAKATVTIKGNDGNISLPEKFFELTADTIYTTSTPDAKIADFSPPKKRLSAGLIAGIVVACIVVVGGIVGFCVYWFKCRNKYDEESSGFKAISN